MNSFSSEVDGFFWEANINFTKRGPLQTSKMESFVKIFDNLKMLTSAASSLDPPRLNYDFQRTKDRCSNENSLVEYVDDKRSLFVFIPNPKCNHDSDET